MKIGVVDTTCSLVTQPQAKIHKLFTQLIGISLSIQLFLLCIIIHSIGLTLSASLVFIHV